VDELYKRNKSEDMRFMYPATNISERVSAFACEISRCDIFIFSDQQLSLILYRDKVGVQIKNQGNWHHVGRVF